MIKELKKGKARLIVSVGSGKTRRRFTRTVVYNKKAELKELYREFEAECQKAPLSEMTAGELIDFNIAYKKSLNLKATTIRGYQSCADRFSEPFRAIAAKRCTTYDIEKEIAAMNQRGLSAKTIKNTIGFLSSAFDHAIYIGQLENNPCKRASLPKGQPREIRILYIDEIPEFLDAISGLDTNEKVAYELALFLGLRRSEILGLRESDIDLARGVVFIHNTRHRVDGVDVEQDTKTKRSTRILALPDILIGDITQLLREHSSFPYNKTEYLIQDGVGNALGHQALASRLARLEKRCGLPRVTLHGLRHTYASLLHAQGVDMANISAELGHSNLSTTMNIYTHMFQSASNASKGIAKTVNSFTELMAHTEAHTENEKPRIAEISTFSEAMTGGERGI